ncbi:MAG: DUF4174 domain-containing protein [Caulobacteraceae bacterium]
MIAAAGVLAMGAMGNPLKAFQWKARVLVISAPSKTDRQYLEQAQILHHDPDGQKDRELEVIPLLGDGEGMPFDVAALRERLSLPPDKFEAVLVGKDGTVVLRRHGPIALGELFTRIDAMPMRRAELRKRAEEAQ